MLPVKFSRFLLRQGCGGQAASKDGVTFIQRFAYTAASRLEFSFCDAIFTLEGDHLMAESKLRTLSVDFAVQILNLVKFLKSQHETIVSNQIGRAGTSIGANIHEAQYAHGKPDFIAKLQIALKEANETSYWLELLLKTNYIDDARYQELNNACSQIRVMLIKSINTAKGEEK